MPKKQTTSPGEETIPIQWGEYIDKDVRETIISTRRLYTGRKIYLCYYQGKPWHCSANKWLLWWVENIAICDVAFPAVMIMSSSLPQKPSKRSRSKDDLIALERRIGLWKKGEFVDLLEEG